MDVTYVVSASSVSARTFVIFTCEGGKGREGGKHVTRTQLSLQSTVVGVEQSTECFDVSTAIDTFTT